MAKIPGGSVLDGEDPPGARDALQLVLATVSQTDLGPRHQVGDGARDKNLARSRCSGDPSADVDGKASQGIFEHLDLTGVEACTHLQAQGR